MSVSRRVLRRAFQRYALFGVVWIAVLALSWFTYEQGRTLQGTGAWAGILHPVVFGLTAWPVVRRFARGERWLTIPNAVLGLTYLSIGLGSVYFVFHYDTFSYGALRRPHEVRPALVAALAGVLAFRFGSEISWLRGVVRRLPDLPATPRWNWGVRAGVFSAIGIAVCIELYLAATGSLGYVTGGGGIVNTGLWSILGYLSEFGLLALSGAYFYWFSGARLSMFDRVFLVLATAALAGLGLLSGMKEEFLFVFFGVVIPYLWTRPTGRYRAQSRAREATFGLCLVGLMILLFAINPIYRAALEELRATDSRIEQAPAATGIVLERITQRYGVVPLLTTGAENAWARLSIFPYQMAVVDQVPEPQPFRGFDRYAMLPAMAVVPRVVWPGKPVNNASTDFQRRFISSEVIYSTTPTIYGWGYMDLGLVGVVMVLFALGVLAGLVEEYLAERNQGTLCGIILYTALFVTLADIEADPFWTLGGIPKIVVVATLVYGLIALPRMLGSRSPRRWTTVERV